jgi:hypothetical protein
LANYSGGRIGSVQQSGDGVRFFTPDQLKLFSTPAAGQSGGLSKDFFRGPFNWNMDTSLVKQIPVHEGQMLMMRLEAYNMVNTVIFANPAADINIPQTFGRISGTLNSPRILQVALRYEF